MAFERIEQGNRRLKFHDATTFTEIVVNNDPQVITRADWSQFGSRRHLATRAHKGFPTRVPHRVDSAVIKSVEKKNFGGTAARPLQMDTGRQHPCVVDYE
jgi:hypothetical protein